jgi:hypothetical protein
MLSVESWQSAPLSYVMVNSGEIGLCTGSTGANVKIYWKGWCRLQDSNLRPHHYE